LGRSVVDAIPPVEPGPDDGYGSSAHAVARRHEDILFVQRIREIDYDVRNPLCQLFIVQLQAYGKGTLLNLWKNKELFPKCKRLGIRGLPAIPTSWPTRAHDLLCESAVLAAVRFITDSLPKWDPGRGASILTYFVNFCLLQFQEIYTSYCKEEAQRQYEVLGDSALLLATISASDDPAALAIARHTITEAIGLIDNTQLSKIIEMKADGANRKQIADALGVSVNTIDRRIKRYRQTLKRNGWKLGR